MAEYIEREALKQNIKNSDMWNREKMSALMIVSAEPTADVAPVVHGRWIKTDRGMREDVNTGAVIRVYLHDCSVCGWHTGNQGRNFNYCPNCGARMDGE